MTPTPPAIPPEQLEAARTEWTRQLVRFAILCHNRGAETGVPIQDPGIRGPLPRPLPLGFLETSGAVAERIGTSIQAAYTQGARAAWANKTPQEQAEQLPWAKLIACVLGMLATAPDHEVLIGPGEIAAVDGLNVVTGPNPDEHTIRISLLDETNTARALELERQAKGPPPC